MAFIFWVVGTVSLSIADKCRSQHICMSFSSGVGVAVYFPWCYKVAELVWNASRSLIARLSLKLLLMSHWLYKFQFIPRSLFLKQCFSSFNVYAKHLGILIKCRFWFRSSVVKPDLLHFSQALHWCRHHWSKDHISHRGFRKYSCYIHLTLKLTPYRS